MELSLYELTAEQQRIEEILIENGGEMTEEIKTLWEQNNNAIAVKVDGYNKVLRKFEGAETALDAEIKRLTALKRTAVNAQKSLKSHLLHVMLEQNISKLEGNLCKVSLRNTKAVEVDDDFLDIFKQELSDLELPDYISVEVKVNKTALKPHIENGDVVAKARIIENTNVIIK